MNNSAETIIQGLIIVARSKGVAAYGSVTARKTRDGRVLFYINGNRTTRHCAARFLDF